MAEHARLFMHLTGAETGMIKGESTVPGRRDWIGIDDWSWSMNRKAVSGGSETVEPTKLMFSKLMDRSSTAMLLAMRRGTLMNATIKMDDADLNAVKLEVQIKKLRIISYAFRTQASDKQTSIQEDWEFDYEAVGFEYQPDSRTGAMKVLIERSPGSTLDSPDDKLNKFLELSRNMSVTALDLLWETLKPKHREEQARLEQLKKEDLDNTKRKNGDK